MKNTLDIEYGKKIMSPRKKNSLSNKLKKRLSLSNKSSNDNSSNKSSNDNLSNKSFNDNSSNKSSKSHELKKITLKTSKPHSKQKNIIMIPTKLSLMNPNTSNTSVIPATSQSNTSDTSSQLTKLSSAKKSSKKKKSKKIHRNSSKSTKNKIISVNLNTNIVEKENDILEIINNFEKMNMKEIKDYLKTKGIESKNNTKSKLLPYIYLLTCVDDDINIIKK